MQITYRNLYCSFFFRQAPRDAYFSHGSQTSGGATDLDIWHSLELVY